MEMAMHNKFNCPNIMSFSLQIHTSHIRTLDVLNGTREFSGNTSCTTEREQIDISTMFLVKNTRLCF